MIMTQEQRDTMRRRQREEECLPDVSMDLLLEYQEPTNTIDLKELAEKIYYLHKPSSKDIEKCLKKYLGGIVS